ncbi:hypothetical protein HYX08_01445 [Candidatus Woesearchaeota archaeon]|nr:hypothetical protein [Candidatus Woesearchaeota archaeon]
MDIDEFLDRELSDLGLQTDKAEKEQIDLPAFKENTASSPLLEGIKVSLDRGNLELAEQSYEQLWRMLVEQKLKWNSELYEQLSSVSRQFAGALNYAYSDMKRKAGHVYELISRARAALKEGKKDAPFKIYSEIEEITSSIPGIFFEEKKILQEQVMDFYKELKGTTDNELVKRVSALVAEISQLIDRINMHLGSNDMTNAILNYNKCTELFSQVPEGFLKHKNQAGMRLLDIYKTLSIYNEISSLQRQLGTRQSAQGQPESRRQPTESNSKFHLARAKKERAKRNMEKGFYNEASKDIQEALQLEPDDAEAKAMHAQIKTLQ